VRRLLVCALILGVTACATTPRLQPPKVSVVGVTVDRRTMADGRFTLRLAIANPNDRELAVEALTADLRVENVVLGTATLTAPVTVGPHAEEVASFAAQGNFEAGVQFFAATMRRIQELGDTARPTLRYSVTGIATVAGGTPVSFDRRGEIPLPGEQR
jgi:LEA14-like dessication related protein